MPDEEDALSEAEHGRKLHARQELPEVVAYDPAAHRKIDSHQRRIGTIEAKVVHNDSRCSEMEKWIGIATESEKAMKELLIDVKTALFGDPRSGENRGLMAEVAFLNRTNKWLWASVVGGYGTIIALVIERIINHKP